MNKVSAILSVLMLVTLSVVTAHFWRLGADVDALATQVEQQTMLLDRALGKELSIKLPPSVDSEIKYIEAQLQTESTWPKAAADIQKLNDRLRGALDRLPPWAQDELLPRVLPRRWEITSLWQLANPPVDDLDGLTNYISTLDDQISSKPAASSEVIAQNLVKARQSAEMKLAQAELDFAHQQAQLAIDKGENLETALSLVINREDEKAKELTVQLKQMIEARAIQKAIPELQGELDRAAALVQSNDLKLRATYLDRISQAVIELRMRAQSANLSDTKIEGLADLDKSLSAKIADSNKQLQLLDSQKLRNYQVWALSEIQRVQSYEIIEKGELDKIHGIMDNLPMSGAKSNARRTAHVKLRQQMIDHMAYIDQSLLDLAVSQWFQMVYQDRLGELEDKEDKLAVVREFANAVKKLPS